jgi:hypothetical protein
MTTHEKFVPTEEIKDISFAETIDYFTEDWYIVAPDVLQDIIEGLEQLLLEIPEDEIYWCFPVVKLKKTDWTIITKHSRILTVLMCLEMRSDVKMYRPHNPLYPIRNKRITAPPPGSKKIVGRGNLVELYRKIG